MIVVAGLTPAWQQILRFDSFRLGEVNRAAEARWCASGKVLNVGIAATLLGAPCRTICPVGGPARAAFERECGELNMAVDWIAASEPTRVCTTLLDDATAETTELVENARPLNAAELRAYLEAYARAAAQADVAVLTGSLPANVPTDFYRELAALTPGRMIVDARGPELLSLLDGVRKPTIVKPNREELAKTSGTPLDDDESLVAAMRSLNARGAEWVVVSGGPQAVWATTRDEVRRLTPPRVERVVNPIGCGDCLAAGIADALARGCEVVEALRFGIAAAVDNLTTLVPARIDRSRAARWAPTIGVERW